MIRSIICLIFITFLTCCVADQITYKDCTDSDPKGYCKITNVQIDPCKEAASGKPCNLKKGKTYAIKMDFTALQPFETMKSAPFWATASADLPFVGMKDNACEFTQCPVAQNAEQIYDFQLKIAKTLPRGQFDVKWKFWVDGDENKGCCARFYLKLS